jgi:hypothetical protein
MRTVDGTTEGVALATVACGMLIGATGVGTGGATVGDEVLDIP